jgi:hypothetical protein
MLASCLVYTGICPPLTETVACSPRNVTNVPDGAATPQRRRYRQALAITRFRKGLSTKSARKTTMKFMTVVATNTMCQLPV